MKTLTLPLSALLIPVLNSVSLTNKEKYEDEQLHAELDSKLSFNENLVTVLENTQRDFTDRVEMDHLRFSVDAVTNLLTYRKAESIDDLASNAFNLIHDGISLKTLYYYIMLSVEALNNTQSI